MPPPPDEESDGETKVQIVTLRRLMPESTLDDAEAVESGVKELGTQWIGKLLTRIGIARVPKVSASK